MRANKICLYGILGSLIFAMKFVMAPFPNIEPVSLLLIAYAITFGKESIYPLITYIFLEVFIYGFGFWSIGYFYMWPLLIIIVLCASKINKHNKIFWASISGLFGLFFGVLYIPLYLISGGFVFAATWWINGIPYDIIHCISNFILCLILFDPLTNILNKLNTIQN